MPTQLPVCSFYLSLTPEMKEYLKSKLRKYKLFLHTESISKDTIHPEAEVLGVFVDSKLTKQMIDAHPKLKLIVTLSTGFDHIDLAYAKKKKIVVCNIPAYGENTVAEHALALLLSLSRKLFASIKRVKEGNFDYHGLRGFDLRGKTVGVIGTGKIGKYFVKLLQGFDVNILAYDPYPTLELEKSFPLKYVTLKKLLSEADVISLHTPLLESTHHLINKKTIAQMKKGVYIINTSRGGLIDSEALLWGINEGRVAGAGLDVLEGEEDLHHPEQILHRGCEVGAERVCLMNNLLIDNPSTIVTPHNAFNSTEAVLRIFDSTIDTVKKFSNGEKLENIVNAQ